MSKIVESWDGFKWLIEREIDRDATRKHEMMVIDTIIKMALRKLWKQSLFVDVGANVGMYTVRLGWFYDWIIAIEPDPYNVKILKRNLKLNKLPKPLKEIIVLQVACGERKGRGKLACKGVSSHLVPDNVSDNVVDVEIKPLDEIVFENVDIGDFDLVVVKVDVEGWEEKVVRGAKELIRKHGAIFIVEHHEYRGYDIKGTHERIIDFFKPTHYCLNLNEVQWLYFPKKGDLSLCREVIANHWFYKCIRNIEQGKPWYFGLPHTWWHGMSILDFYKELPNHVLNEKEWIERL